MSDYMTFDEWWMQVGVNLPYTEKGVAREAWEAATPSHGAGPVELTEREYQLSVSCFQGRDIEWRLALAEYLPAETIAKIERDELVDTDPRKRAVPGARPSQSYDDWCDKDTNKALTAAGFPPDTAHGARPAGQPLSVPVNHGTQFGEDMAPTQQVPSGAAHGARPVADENTIRRAAEKRRIFSHSDQLICYTYGWRDAETAHSSREQALVEALRDWYERLKARDPHHFEEYEDYTVHGKYTFEMFSASPMVQCGLAALRTDAPQTDSLQGTASGVPKADGVGGTADELKAPRSRTDAPSPRTMRDRDGKWLVHPDCDCSCHSDCPIGSQECERNGCSGCWQRFQRDWQDVPPQAGEGSK